MLLPVGGWWLTAVTAVVVTAAYLYSTWTFDYWRKRNVPFIRPLVPLFGNIAGVALGVEHQMRLLCRTYNEFRGHKYCGLYQMRTPYLMICDPELVTRVLIKDFASFTDHGLYTAPPEENPLSNGLFNMNSTQWKVMRHKLSPAFTANKLRLMHGQVKECGDQLMRNFADGLRGTDGRMEVRDVLGRYSTDVIGTCAFGLQLNAISDEDSPFRRHGKAVFTPSLRMLVKELVYMISPSLRRTLHIKDFPPESIDFLTNAFTETIEHRQRNGITRTDLMQALIQARTDLVVNKTEPSGKSIH